MLGAHCVSPSPKHELQPAASTCAHVLLAAVMYMFTASCSCVVDCCCELLQFRQLLPLLFPCTKPQALSRSTTSPTKAVI